jgi:hypothetical protein
MLFQRIKIFLLTIACLLPWTSINAFSAYPANDQLYDMYPWAVTYYYGQTTTVSLVQLFVGNWRRYPEHIQSLELLRTLSPDNFLRRLVSPLVGIVQLAGNVTYRYGKDIYSDGYDRIYEFDPYLAFRWANLPWNQYVNTSLALGEGISYATAVPAVEKKNNSNTKRLLNYMLIEATFAAPSYPRLQFLARIHHRSGCFGLYRAGNSGSNDIGLGLRYLFD